MDNSFGLRVTWVFCAFLAILTAGIYYPGSSGAFLLDDFGTLGRLGQFNQIDSFDKLVQYIFYGVAGPGGRPVALLTFTANAQTWPADSYWFLITNIVIHIGNGILLFVFIRKLLLASERFRMLATRIAWFAAFLWTIHPFYVSTVLYVVQRMTLLSCTFSLLFLIVYLQAREALSVNRTPAAIGLFALAGFLALLGFFAKENVVLLPLQLLLVEWFLSISGASCNSKWHRILTKYCLIPVVLIVVAYPLKVLVEHSWLYLATGVEEKYGRSFTLYERWFTQQRILGDYIIGFLLPRMQSSGVFYDNYPISTGLFSPISTFFWLLFHVSALGGSWFYRRKLPMIFLGVWWFYCSHLMESTVIMLELRFDHRNYIPGIGLFLMAACAVASLPKRLRVYSQGGLIFLLGCLTFAATSLWGDPLKSAMVWLKENPDSQRAHEHAMVMYTTHVGYDENAKALLKSGIALDESPTAKLKYILAFCESHEEKPVDWVRLSESLKSEPRNWSLYNTLEKLLERSIGGECSLLTLDSFRLLLDGYRGNPVYRNTYSVMYMDELEIRAALHFGDLALAKRIEDSREEARLPLAFKMKRAILFANAGHLEYAVEKLDLGVKTAEELRNETEFTLKNAREVLGLMKHDLASSGKAPDD